MSNVNPATSDLVSIVIPCFRQGRYLAAAVNSALDQSYRNVEVIVVDDGSDDDTAAVARQFGNRVLYLRRQNGGPAAARNTGIAEARGRYLLFLDADDLLDPLAVYWLVSAAAGRERVLCVMGVRFFREEEDLESGKVQLPPMGVAAARRLLLNNINPPMAFLCARSMVQAAGGFDPSPRINACEDWEIWLRLLFAGAQVVPMPAVGAFYRQHPGSHSSNEVRMCRSRCEVLRRTREHLRRNPNLAISLDWPPAQLAAELSRLISQEYALAAYVLRGQGRYAAAFEHYCLSLFRGRPNRPALLGACKLLPHKVTCGLGLAPSR